MRTIYKTDSPDSNRLRVLFIHPWHARRPRSAHREGLRSDGQGVRTIFQEKIGPPGFLIWKLNEDVARILDEEISLSKAHFTLRDRSAANRAAMVDFGG